MATNTSNDVLISLKNLHLTYPRRIPTAGRRQSELLWHVGRVSSCIKANYYFALSLLRNDKWYERFLSAVWFWLYLQVVENEFEPHFDIFFRLKILIRVVEILMLVFLLIIQSRRFNLAQTWTQKIQKSKMVAYLQNGFPIFSLFFQFFKFELFFVELHRTAIVGFYCKCSAVIKHVVCVVVILGYTTFSGTS